MPSLVTSFNSLTVTGSTAQEIVNWVTTANWCVHTASTTQLRFAVCKFAQTRQDSRQLVENSVDMNRRRDSTRQ